MANNQAMHPLPAVVRRVMASLDLINPGFYSESFINLFSLVDDLSQEVVKAGLSVRGLAEAEQKGLLRAIKEERLGIDLNTLTKLCGWVSLAEADKLLSADVAKVNSVRNRIMHASHRLNREEAVGAGNVLLRLLVWLRSNPFH
jgi:hypothetical protein